ncbi:MAG: hypothetical protein AAF993_18220, partial [Pseudomonadota bacterium]
VPLTGQVPGRTVPAGPAMTPVAALLDFLLGGREPGRFFHSVIRFGRRTEIWINLFGHQRKSGTADDIIQPLQKRVFAEAQENPLLQKAGASLNHTLDSVGEALNKPGASKSEHKS